MSNLLNAVPIKPVPPVIIIEDINYFYPCPEGQGNIMIKSSISPAFRPGTEKSLLENQEGHN
jgi:hypothetical protein